LALEPLTLDYRPSQPTGWVDFEKPRTLGGHTTARDFALGGRSYRISLLPSGQPGNGLDPVYEDAPADPALRFRETLDAAFGAHYAFRFQGGVPGRAGFSVQSYSVCAYEPTETEPLRFGADLYVVYDPAPRRGGPGGAMRWIQVSASAGNVPGPGGGGGSGAGPRVDNTGLGNPFHRFGGATSVYGQQVGNFSYGIVIPYLQPPGQGDPGALSFRFAAESFLAQETGRKDVAGRAVVDVFGGLRHGWQLSETNGGQA
jgi:hypothetical protein